jgi:hypothetical protein
MAPLVPNSQTHAICSTSGPLMVSAVGYPSSPADLCATRTDFLSTIDNDQGQTDIGLSRVLGVCASRFPVAILFASSFNRAPVPETFISSLFGLLFTLHHPLLICGSAARRSSPKRPLAAFQLCCHSSSTPTPRNLSFVPSTLRFLYYHGAWLFCPDVRGKNLLPSPPSVSSSSVPAATAPTQRHPHPRLPKVQL